ncbi:hypothetical protein GMO_16590 [Gluconobacter morbifer G707]|uniref:Uncharacterized protein n=1 Tax=Gluconobacter morbifer G707 TaxID=1088869 RepID=G6XJT0_9PROT|nr:hypothetical protein GMO_16590 [Gluconobacter morbifer G707]
MPAGAKLAAWTAPPSGQSEPNGGLLFSNIYLENVIFPVNLIIH